jgi:endonuclease/exonuclease/phosphatase (EEP) superfamily protein YafD
MVTAMFCAPRARAPVAPPAPLGVPDKSIRFLADNVYHNYRGTDGTVGQVRKLQPPPDFVMLEEVEPEHIGPMGRVWGLEYGYHPKSFPQKPPVQGWPGVCLMSRYPLYDGRPLRTADGATFGVWVYTVVDGRKFAVAAVHLRATTSANPSHVLEMNRIRTAQLRALMDTWRAEGSPPLVVGGDFNQPAAGENYRLMTANFTDVLASLGKDFVTHRWTVLETRIDYLLSSPQWQPVAGGVIEGEASDHRPIWAEFKAAAPAPAATPPRLLLGLFLHRRLCRRRVRREDPA